jgi:hypothetical protein
MFIPSRSDIAATSKTSFGGDVASQIRPVTPLENTFIMKPERTIHAKPMIDIINSVLGQQLEGEVYRAKECKQLCKTLSTIIIGRVKDLGYDQYKFVCLVTIGPIENMSIRVGSRCLTDQETDTFASGSYKNSSLFATAQVYAVYQE